MTVASRSRANIAGNVESTDLLPSVNYPRPALRTCNAKHHVMVKRFPYTSQTLWGKLFFSIEKLMFSLYPATILLTNWRFEWYCCPVSLKNFANLT
jgi:hypothetical protein